MFGVNIQKFTGKSLSGTTMEVYFLNVGQGNFVIVNFPNGKWMMMDAGVTSGGPGTSDIIKAVNTLVGTDKFTTVVISHPDADHNNLIPLIKQADRPDHVHISGGETDYDSSIQKWFSAVKVRGGTVHTYVANYSDYNPDPDFDSGKCKVYVLSANASGDKNTQSIVLSLDYGATTVLLTGDATSSTERRIMQNWDDDALKTVLLSFGHHGSNHSSSKKFLQIVSPDVGVFSASSFHLGYGHPRCVLIDYVEKMVDENGKYGRTVQTHRVDCFNSTSRQYVFEKNDLGVYSTYTQGNIKFITDGDLYEVWVDQLAPNDGN